jgi:hypothetical protein
MSIRFSRCLIVRGIARGMSLCYRNGPPRGRRDMMLRYLF